MARNIKQNNLKIHPAQFLNEVEKYLYHFWKPKKGHKVIYNGTKYKIKEIINDTQAILTKAFKLEKSTLGHIEHSNLFWLQDLGWKPTITDCDDIATRFNAQITPAQIIFKHDDRRCIFAKPKTIDEYQDIIRQLRMLNTFKENK